MTILTFLMSIMEFKLENQGSWKLKGKKGERKIESSVCSFHRIQHGKGLINLSYSVI